MASKSYCLLGFKDEPIEDPVKANLSFKLNKIGGKPVRCIFKKMIYTIICLDQ